MPARSADDHVKAIVRSGSSKCLIGSLCEEIDVKVKLFLSHRLDDDRPCL